MDQQMQFLFEKMKEEMKRQTEDITNKINQSFDEKLSLLRDENKELKATTEILKNRVEKLEREVRKTHIIIHGVNETEENNWELLNLTLKLLQSKEIKIEKGEIKTVYRLGKKKDGPNKRPILIALSSTWRKLEILKNKKALPNKIYITEDYPKDILVKRKELQPQLEQERSKGKYVFIQYDTLVVKENNNEKRKRSPTNSPQDETVTKKNTAKPATKVTKTNAFSIMGSWPNSPSTSSKNSE